MDDGILERRTTSPMATACLVISFVALLGAISFNLIEIGEIRAGDGSRDATKQRRADYGDLDTRIQALLKAEAEAREDIEKAAGLGDGGDGAVTPDPDVPGDAPLEEPDAEEN